METVTWKLEQEFSGVGAGWTDTTGDVLLSYGGIEWQDGINSTAPENLLANPGDIAWAYDNSPSNSAHLAGYYSPGHASCRSGFAKNTRLRYSLISGGMTYYQNIYWLKTVTPSAGLYEEAVTRCRAVDWLAMMMNVSLPAVAVQTSKRGDELLATLLAAIALQPASSSYATGDSTFASGFDVDNVDQDSIYSILGKIARSEFGRIYLAGQGVLTFENRNARLGNLTSLGTITNVMDGIEIQDDAGEVYDQVKVSIVPRRAEATLVVLASLDYHLPLHPGEEKTFTLNYVEQTSGSRISGSNIQVPEISTDYKFGTTDGSTEDLNACLGVTMVQTGANSADIKVKNNGAVSGYVNLFQVRGYGIYPYNAYTVQVGTGGLRVLSFDMPYQNNPITADAVCNYLQAVTSDNTRRGARVKIHANKSAELMLAALTGLISTRWTIAETQTALGGGWFINGRHGTIGPGNRFDMEWTVVPAGSTPAWILDTSALGTNTVLTV